MDHTLSTPNAAPSPAGLSRTTEPVPQCWGRLDPDVLPVAQAIAEVLTTPVRELGAEAARQLLATAPSEPALTPLDRVEELTVPTRAGHLRARHYHSPCASAPRPALLYLHGGGFVLGTLDGVDEVCRAIAARSGWDVLSLEYRLAPEHPYPAALHDALDTLAWLRTSGSSLGVDPDIISVGGDSAGGNLAAALCLYLRDHHLPEPVSQVLVYPAVDDTFTAASWSEFAKAPLLSAADARWFWEQYVATDRDGSADHYTAPMRAASLRGLPPTLVLTAEVDPLRDDAEAFAERLRRHGVSVTAIRYSGVFHGFFTELGIIHKAETAIDDVARHLQDVASRMTTTPNSSCTGIDEGHISK
ncbi:alpha/beta hydrolase [Skermania sp. ID1734]|uniref:alpha/beta hydrolase n=1 Tax=Skermania sp. ID1734 TaxID=2597516 RepID=UPI00117DD423|nr:alpha/beta hydrolase [Skermania sp. ID1734]TSE01145.1 alpha/beta hydrolase [Skermania sp. ID1734]